MPPPSDRDLNNPSDYIVVFKVDGTQISADFIKAFPLPRKPHYFVIRFLASLQLQWILAPLTNCF